MAWLPAKGTLSRRTYLIIIGSTALAVLILTITFLSLLEKNEQTFIERRLSDELEYFVSKLDEQDRSQQLNTQYFQIYYQTRAQTAEPLPPLFRDLPATDDSGNNEILLSGRQYHYLIQRLPEGKVYALQDITAMGAAERYSLLRFAVASLLTLLFSLVIGTLSSRYLTRPLDQLTHAIANTKTLTPIDAGYREAELEKIASAFNGFLDETRQHLQRERDLVNMASHELRTPIAIASGALEIIALRDNLNAKDQATLERARLAIDEMQQNTTTLLKLSRGKSLDEPDEWIVMAEFVAQVLEKLALYRTDVTRIQLQCEPDCRIRTSPILLGMLLNNLLRNALQHSSGQVIIDITCQQIEVLSDTAFELSRSQGNGLGLFIVSMICQRLNWELQQPQDQQGVRLLIPDQPAVPKTAASQ